MQRTAPSTRDSRLSHSRKRRRLTPTKQLPTSPLPPDLSPHFSAGIKRSRSTTLKPAVSLKRRPISSHTSPMPSVKRRRVCDKPDIDMVDAPASTTSTPSRRPTRLHDVVRRERASSAVLRETHVRRAEAVRQEMGRHARPIIEDSMSETLVSGSPRAAPLVAQEEEVLEEVDASENTEIPHENVAPGVRAALLQDGRCAVHIVREDGTTQMVIIEPPGSGEDEYAWYG